MAGFRVSKYNPRMRSADGFFMGDEWTSVSDIGRLYPNGPLTLADYLSVEETYLETIRCFVKLTGVHSFRISGLEIKPNGDTLPTTMAAESTAHLGLLVEGALLSGQDLEWVIRLNLRELAWCRLEGERGAYIHFGYDYYMYIGVDTADFIFPPPPAGIYVEPFETPYHAIESHAP